ncbi:MAG: hypothetical protein WBG73_16770 [Coleofasciculaceae cyanobacterium]
MVSPNLLEIERSILALSLEEQQWLLERLNQKVQVRKLTADQLADVTYMESQIRAMANDPDIQSEIAAINKEFAITEMDGLSGL